MTDSVPVRVQDHSFFVGDSEAAMPFETMDYSTGLAGVMESAMLVAAGINRGTVQVSAQAADRDPGLDQHWPDTALWEDIADVSVFCPHGELTVELLESGPFDSEPDLPVLSAHGPGHYRLRLFAVGRDLDFDQVVQDSQERFKIVAWPAPPAPPIIVRATSRCGYGLRLSAILSPRATTPLHPDPNAPTEHQAFLDRTLRGE